MLAVGTVVAGRYRIERFLAAGGMGAVYAARDLRLDQPVALKVSTFPAGQTGPRQRFAREARLGGRLGRLPGIVRATDWGEAPEQAGALYLALDLVAGARPLDVVRQGTLEERLSRLARAARLVASIHAAGVVHRDLKPHNFLVEPSGALWLSDFGIAKVAGESDLFGDEPTGGLTATGTAMGTPVYMAPEQLEDAKRADARADVYALGVMLFTALTGGQLPYPGPSGWNVGAQQVKVQSGGAPAPRPRDHDPAVPAALDALCARALELDRERRLASADELARALEAVVAAHDPAGSAPTAPPAPADLEGSAPTAPAAPAAPRGAPAAALVVKLAVVPILAGREWIEETAFAPVEDWERWLVGRRWPGAAVEVRRLTARAGPVGPLRLPQHAPFIDPLLAELGSRGALYRAYAVLRDGAWAVVVRVLSAALPDAASFQSWETVPEAEGTVWSAPVAHDREEFAEALERFGAADWHVRGDVVAAYRAALEVLGRLGRASTVVGPAIPEVWCPGCSLGSLHGLVAALARGELDRGAPASVILRSARGEVQVSEAQLRGPWRCPRCGGDAVRLRFSRAWDGPAAPGGRVAPAVEAGGVRLESVGDPVARAARAVAESAGGLVVVVSSRREHLDGVAARLRALGLPPERLVRGGPAGVDHEDTLARGDARCLLLDPGPRGPERPLPLGAYGGRVEVVVLDGSALAAGALEAVRRAAGGAP